MLILKLVAISFPLVAIVALGLPPLARAVESICPGGTNPNPAIIWCDDFDDNVALGTRYYDYDNAGGRFVKAASTGLNGTTGVQATFQAGVESAGHFILTFGRNPADSRTKSTVDFREIYYRIYVRTQPGWTSTPPEGASKFSRVTSFVDSNWSQSMIAHLWSGSTNNLELDPASCVSGNTVQCIGYNDFAHLNFLGRAEGTTALFSGGVANQWRCVEIHVRLNDPGESNGLDEFWVDGNLQAHQTGLNFTGSYTAYGLNTLFIENYWNDGAPLTESRYFDNLVVSTERIGCIGDSTGFPSTPIGLVVQ